MEAWEGSGFSKYQTKALKPESIERAVRQPVIRQFILDGRQAKGLEVGTGLLEDESFAFFFSGRALMQLAETEQKLTLLKRH